MAGYVCRRAEVEQTDVIGIMRFIIAHARVTNPIEREESIR
jgi:hypothetical protein